MAKAEAKKSSVKITDELFGEYYLSRDENQFSLMREGFTAPVGYYSTLGGALKKIARIRSIQDTPEQVTMQEYITAYDSITSKLINKFK